MDKEEILMLLGGAGFALFSTIFMFIMTIFTLGIAAIMLISQWKIFVKMGLEGWKGIIPYYNTYIMFDKFWSKKMFFIFVGATLLPAFMSISMGLLGTIISLVSVEVLMVIMSLFLLLIENIFCFGLVGIMIVFTIKMAHAFGKPTAFGVGLTLLSPVFFPILAFGNAQYIGRAD